MDAIVEAALRKWPHVPHCYGWLALDARGDWYMRDDRTQAAGAFPQPKGSRIEHDKLRAFIERNRAVDQRGAWFFQNGPQRVYLQLEAAPLVWRLTPAADGSALPQVHSHTGTPAAVQQGFVDEGGRLFLQCDTGYGIVHSQDMVHAAAAVDAGLWQPQALAFADMPARFGYVLDPQPPA